MFCQAKTTTNNEQLISDGQMIVVWAKGYMLYKLLSTVGMLNPGLNIDQLNHENSRPSFLVEILHG